MAIYKALHMIKQLEQILFSLSLAFFLVISDCFRLANHCLQVLKELSSLCPMEIVALIDH